MTILVTGATGLLGRALVERLAPSEPVRALARSSADVSDLEALGAEIVRGDIGDPPSLRDAVEGCALVYHAAGRTSTSGPDPQPYMAVNAGGTRNIAEAAAAAGVRRLVLLSSSTVYGGLITDHAISELTPLRPDSPYGRSKLAGERSALALHGGTGPSVVIARLTTVLGPRARAWLPVFRSAQTVRPRYVGTGENHLHPIDVADAVEGLLLCGTVERATGRTYVLAGPEPAPLAEVLGMISKEMGGQPPRRSSVPAACLRLYARVGMLAARTRLGRLPRLASVEFLLADRVFDTTRARAELGFEPRVSVRAMIRRTADWCRQERVLPASSRPAPGA